MAHCIQETDIDDPNSGSLCIFITPPATLNTTFGRAFFFLLDRSGSMMGEPFREAQRALTRALDRLRPSDQFNICAFDHRDTYYQPSLVPVIYIWICMISIWLHILILLLQFFTCSTLHSYYTFVLHLCLSMMSPTINL